MQAISKKVIYTVCSCIIYISKRGTFVEHDEILFYIFKDQNGIRRICFVRE